MSSGIVDYGPTLIDTDSPDPYIGLYDPSRITGTNKFLFLNERAPGFGRQDMKHYDIKSDIVKVMTTTGTFNGDIFGGVDNSVSMINIQNASGDTSDLADGTYLYGAQATVSSSIGFMYKYTIAELTTGFANTYPVMETLTIRQDFLYSGATDRSKSVYNWTHDDKNIYLIQNNPDGSSPGPVNARLYKFDPTVGSNAEYILGGSGTAPFPSGLWSFVTEVPNVGTNPHMHDMFIYDLENNIDIIVDGNDISTSGSIGIIPYILYNQASGSISILPIFSTDTGATWTECTDGAGGDGRSSLSSAPSGATHIYHWDVLSDINSNQTNDLMFRVVAF